MVAPDGSGPLGIRRIRRPVSGDFIDSYVPTAVVGTGIMTSMPVLNTIRSRHAGGGCVARWGATTWGNWHKFVYNAPISVPTRSAAWSKSRSAPITARAQTRRVWCWGANDVGQLGAGNKYRPLCRTLQQGHWHRKIAIAAGSYHTCALMAPGSNISLSSVALGQQSEWSVATVQRQHQPQRRSQSAVLAARITVSFIAAARPIRARFTDRSVQCWGTNLHGALGDGVSTAATRRERSSDCRRQPVASTASPASRQATRAQAIMTDGGIRCWGYKRVRSGWSRPWRHLSDDPAVRRRSGLRT